MKRMTLTRKIAILVMIALAGYAQAETASTWPKPEGPIIAIQKMDGWTRVRRGGAFGWVRDEVLVRSGMRVQLGSRYMQEGYEPVARVVRSWCADAWLDTYSLTTELRAELKQMCTAKKKKTKEFRKEFQRLRQAYPRRGEEQRILDRCISESQIDSVPTATDWPTAVVCAVNDIAMYESIVD